MFYHFFFYSSIDCWNSLSLILKQSMSVNIFKHSLKAVDLEHYFNGSASNTLYIILMLSLQGRDVR